MASIIRTEPDAGHWSIRPVGSFGSVRRYVSDTMVLETTFTTASASSSRANTDGPSKRGKHNQSTEPDLLTRAPEWQSEISP
jgi:hypothetical protein